jgi:hypothetical protein
VPCWLLWWKAAGLEHVKSRFLPGESFPDNVIELLIIKSIHSNVATDGSRETTLRLLLGGVLRFCLSKCGNFLKVGLVLQAGLIQLGDAGKVPDLTFSQLGTEIFQVLLCLLNLGLCIGDGDICNLELGDGSTFGLGDDGRLKPVRNLLQGTLQNRNKIEPHRCAKGAGILLKGQDLCCHCC